jgi:hypothetical protein
MCRNGHTEKETLRTGSPERPIPRIKGALSSGDFIVTPDVSGSPSHLRYVYDPPKSLHVVDVNLITLDYGTLASTDIHLRLVPNGN